MTEDTSLDNLRKFLKSDDPALVQMGLSMAAGIEVSKEILAEILWLSTFHADEKIRKLIASSFSKLVPAGEKKPPKRDFSAVEKLFKLSKKPFKCGVEYSENQNEAMASRHPSIPWSNFSFFREFYMSGTSLNPKNRLIDTIIKFLSEDTSNSFLEGTKTESRNRFHFMKEIDSVIRWYPDDSRRLGNYNHMIRDSVSAQKIHSVLNGNQMYTPYGDMRTHHMLLLHYLEWEPSDDTIENNNLHAELLLTHTIESVLEDEIVLLSDDWEVKSIGYYSNLIEEIVNTHSRGKISSLDKIKHSFPVFFIAILKKLREKLDLNEEFSKKIDDLFNDIAEHIEFHALLRAESLIENYDDWYQDHVDNCLDGRGDDEWFEEERSAQDYEYAEEVLYNDDNYLMGFDEWDAMFEEWKKGILILGWIGTLQSIRILRNITLQKSGSGYYSGRNSGAGYHVPYDTVTAFCFSLNTAIDNLSKKDKEAERLERVKENTLIKYPLSEDAFIDLLDRNSKGKSKKKRRPDEWKSIRRRGTGIYFCPFCDDDFDESELDDDFLEFGCEGCRELRSEDERLAKEKAKSEESSKKAREATKKSFHDLMGDEYEKYLRNIDEWDTKRKKWKGQKIMEKASKDIVHRRKILYKKFGEEMIEKLTSTNPASGLFHLELCYTEEQNELFRPLQKTFNLTQKEFNRIVEDRDVIMKVLNDPCTSEVLIDNISSPQMRWLVACLLVEFSCMLDIRDLTIENLMRSPITIFWNQIDDYSVIITKKDICEWIKIQPFLPPIFSVAMGKNLYNYAMKASHDKKASATLKKNRRMIITFFEEPEVAKRILGVT